VLLGAIVTKNMFSDNNLNVLAMLKTCPSICYIDDINILFFDQEKAFDRINRNILWETLDNYNVKGQLLDKIRALYQNYTSVVTTTEGITERSKQQQEYVRVACSHLCYSRRYINRVKKQRQ
jgi:hypothetical protein